MSDARDARDTHPSPYQWPQPPLPSPPRPDRRTVVLAAVIAGAAGLLIGAVVGGLVVFALGTSGVFNPDPLTRGPGGKLARFDLAVGQCANGKVEPGSGFGRDAAVPCSESHDFEVYASTVPPGRALSEEQDGDRAVRYPNADDLAAFADDHCLLAFEGFVGSDFDGSDLDFTGIIPSRAAWEAGDRTVACALWQADGDSMVGSARDSGR